jgi:hypothetical protein
MTGDREENGIEADDPGEDRADDPDVEIHEAILARSGQAAPSPMPTRWRRWRSRCTG